MFAPYEKPGIAKQPTQRETETEDEQQLIIDSHNHYHYHHDNQENHHYTIMFAKIITRTTYHANTTLPDEC